MDESKEDKGAAPLTATALVKLTSEELKTLGQQLAMAEGGAQFLAALAASAKEPEQRLSSDRKVSDQQYTSLQLKLDKV